MLEVRQLGVRYPGQDFLFQDLSFQVSEGEVLWLRGPNGAGKTTLLYAVSNIIPSSVQAERQGSVFLNGENITTLPINKLIPKLSIVLSNPAWEMFFSTAEEEILFALENMGLPEKEIEQRLKTIAEQFELMPMLNEPSLHFSAGWQKMLVLAVHAAIRPQVLLLDEPFAGLSDESVKKVINCLKDYLAKGGCLILAEHSSAVTELEPVTLNLSLHSL
ncbi:MAG TPA: ABC transporter ATP-binding protein [Candidatus Cloacimonadota bacterium]|nr:ABC transporter ATP-binding protein [Candidatus Cloacimonadota bacterium]